MGPVFDPQTKPRAGGYTDRPAPGEPAAVVYGLISPAVTRLALVQDGQEDRRTLRRISELER
jgi:hypothetical protein